MNDWEYANEKNVFGSVFYSYELCEIIRGGIILREDLLVNLVIYIYDLGLLFLAKVPEFLDSAQFWNTCRDSLSLFKIFLHDSPPPPLLFWCVEWWRSWARMALELRRRFVQRFSSQQPNRNGELQIRHTVPGPIEEQEIQSSIYKHELDFYTRIWKYSSCREIHP